jgi:hypothetical protein
MTDPRREMLRHLVATIAYRGGIAISNVNESFSEFRAGTSTRSAGEILSHLIDLMEGSLNLCRGDMIFLNSTPKGWKSDSERFFAAIKSLDLYLAGDQEIRCPIEKLLQGPLSDALTHIGQVLMLRRLAGIEVSPQSYYRAEIVAGKIDITNIPS